MSLKGRAFTGKLENLAKSLRDNFMYATLSKIGSGRVALDIVQKKYAQVSTGNIIEAGSNDNLLVKTGHGLKEGYLIRLTSTANSIIEDEVTVDEIVDANSVRLAAILSASLVAGDTFDVYKPVAERVAGDGSSLATLIAPPIQIIKNGSAENVADDTNPANIVPIPVKVVDASGNQITINAGDINVNLNDQGVNFDRTRIGDGVNQLGITAAGEAKVHDADVKTALADLLTELQLKADLTDAQPVALDTLDAQKLTNIQDSTDLTATTLGTPSDAVATTDTGSFSLISFIKRSMQNWTALLAKLPALVGGRVPVDGSGVTQPVSGTFWQATQPVSLASAPLPSGAATSAKQDAEAVLIGAVNESAPANDTASAGLNGRLQRLAQNITTLMGKLPSALGQTTKSGSLSVTVASDQIVATQDAAGTTGSTNKGTLGASGTASHAAPANALGFFLKVLGSSAGDLFWEVGGSATTGSSDLTAGQGTAFIPCSGTVSLLADSSGATYCLQWVIK